MKNEEWESSCDSLLDLLPDILPLSMQITRVTLHKISAIAPKREENFARLIPILSIVIDWTTCLSGAAKKGLRFDTIEPQTAADCNSHQLLSRFKTL